MQKHPTLLLTLAATAAALALLLALGAGGWPGETNGCFETQRPTCFCEGPHRGLLAQPSNTLSNVGFIGMGLLLAWVTDRDRARRAAGTRISPSNLITDSPFFASVYAVAVALLGPGSMALHASMTFWGGQVDVASMYVYSGLLIALAATRTWPMTKTAFLLLYLLLAGALVVSKVWTSLDSNVVFGATLAVWVGLEIAIHRRPGGPTLDLRWAALTVLCFGSAFAIWVPSLSGGPLCDPASWLQGHAAWHLLCACATGAIYLYLRSERRTEPALG